jgi:hypothetical protein
VISKKPLPISLATTARFSVNGVEDFMKSGLTESAVELGRHGPARRFGLSRLAILGSIYIPVKNIKYYLHCNLDLKLGFTGQNTETGSIRGENTPLF